MVVEVANACEVKFVSPKAELVIYTAKTKVVMTVLKGWVPQSHIPQLMIRLTEVCFGIESAVTGPPEALIPLT